MITGTNLLGTRSTTGGAKCSCSNSRARCTASFVPRTSTSQGSRLDWTCTVAPLADCKPRMLAPPRPMMRGTASREISSEACACRSCKSCSARSTAVFSPKISKDGRGCLSLSSRSIAGWASASLRLSCSMLFKADALRLSKAQATRCGKARDLESRASSRPATTSTSSLEPVSRAKSFSLEISRRRLAPSASTKERQKRERSTREPSPRPGIGKCSTLSPSC
mmetsp:Transcript_6972/g.12331  ORF Transcript_6972/g.12331 Transcript_6972/m.12331 type:complete len:223 (-) Transcript_6972:1218-1886(-)